MPKQTNPFRDCAEDEVFVVTTFEDGSVGRTRKKKTELTAEDKVLKCIVCGEPACWVDRLWPVETHDNRCEKHVNSLIDENVYDQYGVGVVVCRDHNMFLHIVYGMDACADWCLKHQDNPAAEPLREKMIAFKQELDKFMAKQWPDEQFAPQKEAKEPDKTLGGTKMFAAQFLGANASHVAYAIGGTSVSLPSFGVMQLFYKGVNYMLHSGDVVVRHCDGTIEIMTEHDFHHKYPALELQI